MEKIVLKRLEQLKSKSKRFFTLESYQIELKAWEIIFEEVKNSKRIHDFRDLIKLFALIKQFYGDAMEIFEKNIELFTLKLNSPQIYKCDLKRFGDDMIKKISVTLNCIKSYQDNRLV